uniref:WAP domain-containing protein n=1 Tax=Spermophilus dauricus TaxID=99837 RepID=A0A8C9PWY6_SPEDA
MCPKRKYLSPTGAMPGFQVMCPEPSSSEEMPCTPACLTDEDCLSNTKCCPSACGLSCRTPIIGLAHVSPEAAPKAGSCPWVNNQISQLCQEEDECSRDSECYGDKKCCMSNCARRCLDPVQANSSYLPVTSTSFTEENGGLTYLPKGNIEGRGGGVRAVLAQERHLFTTSLKK